MLAHQVSELRAASILASIGEYDRPAQSVNKEEVAAREHLDQGACSSIEPATDANDLETHVVSSAVDQGNSHKWVGYYISRDGIFFGVPVDVVQIDKVFAAPAGVQKASDGSQLVTEGLFVDSFTPVLPVTLRNSPDIVIARLQKYFSGLRRDPSIPAMPVKVDENDGICEKVLWALPNSSPMRGTLLIAQDQSRFAILMAFGRADKEAPVIDYLRSEHTRAQAIRFASNDSITPKRYDTVARPIRDGLYAVSAALKASQVEQRAHLSLISVEANRPHEKEYGSGFIVGPELAVTNSHVFKVHARGQIISNHQHYEVNCVLARSEAHDLVILKVSGMKGSSVVLDDGPPLEVGDLVYSYGNPLGLDATFSAGS